MFSVRVEHHQLVGRNELNHVGDVVRRIEPKPVFADFGLVVTFTTLPNGGDALKICLGKDGGVVDQEGWPIELVEVGVKVVGGVVGLVVGTQVQTDGEMFGLGIVGVLKEFFQDGDALRVIVQDVFDACC